jgi:VIT1/CCC1 family predicted Fe2+/Mn2+ transporter
VLTLVYTGLTVPFALTAGLSSLGSSRLVYVAGVAELVSGALSMGVGGYLSAQAERDHYRYLRKSTRVSVCHARPRAAES